MKNLFCTYLTFYSGNKLPPFYIGSSSVKRIESGYHGTVLSKKYKNSWQRELKDNPQLFKTKIIKTFSNRIEALEHEKELQVINDAIKSNLFVNMSYACPNGFFGNGTSGKDHPRFGRKYGPRSKESLIKQKLTLEKTYSKKSRKWFKERARKSVETKIKNGGDAFKTFLGRTHSEKSKMLMSQKQKGISKTAEHIKNMGFHKNNSIQLTCPHCDIVGQLTNMKHWHFDNCPIIRPRQNFICENCKTVCSSKATYTRYHGKKCLSIPQCSEVDPK